MKRYAQDIFNDFSSAEKDLEELEEDDSFEEDEETDEEDEIEFDGTITAPVRSYKVVGKVGVFDLKTHPGGHNGDDLAAPKGTSIYAIAPGKVSFITREGGPNTMGGNTVSTIHKINDKTITTYNAHLDSIDVAVGDEIDQNTIIGTVGNSGNARATGPHLHFEMRINGSLVEPLNYFGKKLVASKLSRLTKYCDLFYRLTLK